jgi:uncharacterized protein (TIGR02001 family)
MPAQPSQRPARDASAIAARRTGRAPRCEYVVALLALTLLSSEALAQASGSVALLSDYRYRGVSLSSGKPAAQIAGAYDDPQGWYAGGALSAVLAHCFEDCGGVQAIAYGGYAVRQSSGLAWDVGGDFLLSAATRDYHFGEVYAGLTFRDFNARVYYAPDYFGQSVAATYGELNQTIPLGDRFRLIGHVGLLYTGNGPYGIPSNTRTDVLLGAAADVQGFELQLSWQHAAAQNGYSYTAYYADERRNRWVFVVSHAF